MHPFCHSGPNLVCDTTFAVYAYKLSNFIWIGLKPNSITLAGSKLVRSWSQTGLKLVADLQRAEIWPII